MECDVLIICFSEQPNDASLLVLMFPFFFSPRCSVLANIKGTDIYKDKKDYIDVSRRVCSVVGRYTHRLYKRSENSHCYITHWFVASSLAFWPSSSSLNKLKTKYTHWKKWTAGSCECLLVLTCLCDQTFTINVNELKTECESVNQ